MLEVKPILNSPINSVCYILFDKSFGNSAILIDPGSESNVELCDMLAELVLLPKYIILTHEHFDHCWGVNSLRSLYPDIVLICSTVCSKRIGDSKTNCSVFYDNTKSFEILPADVTVEEIKGCLLWNNHKIKIVSTPGHTSGSISVLADNYVFTGDAWIPGVKTVTKLPTGNRQQANESINYIKSIINEGFIVCPGHGDKLVCLK